MGTPPALTGDDRTSLRRHIDDEQAEFVALLRQLSEQDWSRASLCRGWSVRDVVTHIAIHTHTGDLERVIQVARARFSETRHIREYAHLTTGELVEWLGSTPTLSGSSNMRIQLAELVVHHQDVRRPLGLPRTIVPTRLTLLLDAALTRTGSASVAFSRHRSRGIRLVATDIEWSAGRGPEALGPAEAIYMALNGRGQAVADLTGPGATLLAGRVRR